MVQVEKESKEPGKAGMRWREAANLLLALAILVAIDFIFRNVAFSLLGGQALNLHYTATLNLVILWVLALAVIWYILRAVKKPAAAEKEEVSKSERFITGVIMAVPFVLIFASRGLGLDKMPVFSTNGLVLILVPLLLSLGCRWLGNRS